MTSRTLADAMRGTRLVTRSDEADAGEDFAKKIREYHSPDFSDWKAHDAFESAFANLFRDLRAHAPLKLPG